MFEVAYVLLGNCLAGPLRLVYLEDNSKSCGRREFLSHLPFLLKNKQQKNEHFSRKNSWSLENEANHSSLPIIVDWWNTDDLKLLSERFQRRVNSQCDVTSVVPFDISGIPALDAQRWTLIVSSRTIRLELVASRINTDITRYHNTIQCQRLRALENWRKPD